MTTTTDWYHEKALRHLDIDAEIVVDSSGRVLVSMTYDALDTLLDGVEELTGLDDRLAEVENEAHEVGYDTGHTYGYEEACNDITDEMGAAWDIVSPLLTVRYDDGYQAACEDIAALGKS